MKAFTDLEMIEHLESAILSLRRYLYSLRLDNSKRAVLLSYWVKDYVSLLKKEEDFSVPQHKYNRGDIVQINLGFKIGRELGGRHFAVVIDNNNSMKSDIVTVVPLTSFKESGKLNNSLYKFVLKKGLWDLHNEKFDKLYDEAVNLQSDVKKLIENPDFDEKLFKKAESMLKKVESKLAELRILSDNISKLKNGTVVNVSQVTTVSKMRISNPKQKHDSLNGIKLCGDDLDKLNEMLINLYIH